MEDTLNAIDNYLISEKAKEGAKMFLNSTHNFKSQFAFPLMPKCESRNLSFTKNEEAKGGNEYLLISHSNKTVQNNILKNRIA